MNLKGASAGYCVSPEANSRLPELQSKAKVVFGIFMASPEVGWMIALEDL